MHYIDILKRILPPGLMLDIKKFYRRKLLKEYQQLSTKEVFTKIYKENVWGDKSLNPTAFYSGGGSHDPQLIEPYITAVKKFLSEFPEKPDVLDIGCGDFNIGSKIRSSCNKYIACDIVDALIEQNKRNYKELNVEFIVFDLVSEKCKESDVIILRQVLQHLSNEDIKRGLENIIPNCRYLILTEHVPVNPDFKRNMNKVTGPDVRAGLNSGIDISAPPFNYKLKSECICEVFDQSGIIKTVVYTCNEKQAL